ncbi:MAG: L-histidine N(alpha)-methyltransferase [Bacteroidia bacterium]|nr:L-histidine N(alpha)-methyltransferase [Bacteroidia bacterium]
MNQLQVSTSAFALDVREGLSASPKRLPSRYFYDARGSELFREIMRMEAYYPTRCEYEIFERQGRELAQALMAPGGAFQLVEFGAGDGLKTRLLLEALLRRQAAFAYTPIDISGSELRRLAQALRQEMPQLTVDPLEGEYFEALRRLNQDAAPQRKAILFLGSNIGNFTEPEARTFLDALGDACRPGDLVLIGFDLKKDPRVILQAYDDPEGITRAFNFNLLSRMNRELGADFEHSAFDHYATYDPLSGETRSYLVSRRRQTVRIAALELEVDFGAWEPVWVELSQKYDTALIRSLAEGSGFRIQRQFTDSKGWFADALLEKV